MKSKLGAGHVEVILSFIIFVGFLIFLFFIFNPFDLTRDSSLVDSIFLNLEEDLFATLTEFSINLNEAPNGCFSITNLDDFNCQAPAQISVRDENGERKDANFNPNTINIAHTAENKFYTIVCSEDIESFWSPQGCTLVPDGDYSLGIISEKTVWSMVKLEQFKNDYETSDEEVMEKYVPVGNDFGIRLWDLEDNLQQEDPLISAGEVPEGIRVDAKTVPIDVLETNGLISKRTLTILTW